MPLVFCKCNGYLFSLFLLITVGCNPQVTSVPSSNLTKITQGTTATRNTETTPAPTQTSIPDLSSPHLTTTATPYPCNDQVCYFPGHFTFSIPVGDEYNQQVEPSYPYGGTQGGKRDPHHGVEFINPSGTPVMAAGDGRVVYAGTDANTLIGAMLFYYGNLVIIEHQLPGPSTPVFTLYAHLSKIQTQTGAWVEKGEIIGEIGRTGKAIGSHLHFEVREGVNDYDHTRNPELWLNPGKENGIVIGQIFNDAGEIRRYPTIRIIPADDQQAKPIQPIPYAVSSVNGDSLFKEIFATAPLLEGKYILTFSVNRNVQTIEFRVIPGVVTRITLHTKY